jgi:putative transposase
MNRGNRRADIFHKPADYEAILRLLGEGLEKYPLEVLAITLIPNHWHLVLRPGKDGQMGCLLGWLTATQTLRYGAHYHQEYQVTFVRGRSRVFLLRMTSIFTFFVDIRYVPS